MPDSPPENEVEVTAADEATKDVAAESSAATQDQGAETLLESVQAALKGDDKESSPDSERDPPATEPEPKETAAEADDAPVDLDAIEGDLKRYHPKTQKRIQALLDDRRASREEIERLRPMAEQFTRIEQYRETSNLTVEDVGVTLEIAALIRNDPFKARERLAPIMRKLDEITGNVLPEALTERARLGYISEEDARVLAATKAENEFRRRQADELQQRQAAQEQARAQENLVRDVSSAATDWETAKKRTDPDWSVKQSRIHELIELEVRRTGQFPDTKAKTIQMLDGIHKRVSDEFAKIAPKPREVRSVTGVASTSAVAEPKSALEAAKRALGMAS